ncbi:hypothetical protein NVV94_23525 [Pseudomonas sp. LS1212]|uniref:hypothetical protein n=1 Tax=Pseudomonas sp. LS1212 TaxID=2972478 RepID=UPI00215CE42F|nr:hypothetical protein [Pseudomonas sp. LS1212]UVJ43485.1 hypothetical protein NVV94_23525 [Pseudomonas sp. LS1212]
MIQRNIFLLPEDKCALWAKASANFPGEKLGEIMKRTLSDLSKERFVPDFYEIRRVDVPAAFDALLKLQSTGLAHRHFETDNEEIREVLEIEMTLLNAIMIALALLLDVFFYMLPPNASGGDKLPPTASGVENKPYVPTWKRQPQVGYDGPSL